MFVCEVESFFDSNRFHANHRGKKSGPTGPLSFSAVVENQSIDSISICADIVVGASSVACV